MSRPTAWPRSSFPPLGANCPATSRCVQNFGHCRRTAATAAVYAEACSRALQAVMWKVVAADLSPAAPPNADGNETGHALVSPRDLHRRTRTDGERAPVHGSPESVGPTGQTAASAGDVQESSARGECEGASARDEDLCRPPRLTRPGCEGLSEGGKEIGENRTGNAVSGASGVGGCAADLDESKAKEEGELESPYRDPAGADAQGGQTVARAGVYTEGESWLSLGNPQQLLVPTGSFGELRKILFCPAKHCSCAACRNGSLFEEDFQQGREDAPSAPDPQRARSPSAEDTTQTVGSNARGEGKQLFVTGDEKEWPKLTSSERDTGQADSGCCSVDTPDAFKVLEASVGKLRQSGLPSQLLLLRFYPRPRRPREATSSVSETRAESTSLEPREVGSRSSGGDASGCCVERGNPPSEPEEGDTVDVCASAPASKDPSGQPSDSPPPWLTLEELLLGADATEKESAAGEGESEAREGRVLVSLLGQRAGTADGPERVVAFAVDRSTSARFLRFQKSKRRAEAKKVSSWCACEADRWLSLSACGTAFARVSWQATRLRTAETRGEGTEITGGLSRSLDADSRMCGKEEKLFVKEVVLCVVLVRIVDWKIAPFPPCSAGWPLPKSAARAKNWADEGQLQAEEDSAQPSHDSQGVQTAQDGGSLPVPWVPARVEIVDEENGSAVASRGNKAKQTEGQEAPMTKSATSLEDVSFSERLGGTEDPRWRPNVNLYLGAAVFPIFSLCKTKGEPEDRPCDDDSPVSVVLLSRRDGDAEAPGRKHMQEHLLGGKDPAGPTLHASSPFPLTQTAELWPKVPGVATPGHVGDGDSPPRDGLPGNSNAEADRDERVSPRGQRPASPENQAGMPPAASMSSASPEAENVTERRSVTGADGLCIPDPGFGHVSALQVVEKPLCLSREEASEQRGAAGGPVCAPPLDVKIQEQDEAAVEAVGGGDGGGKARGAATGLGEEPRHGGETEDGPAEAPAERETNCVSPQHQNDALRPNSNTSSLRPPSPMGSPSRVTRTLRTPSSASDPSFASPSSTSSLPPSASVPSFSPSEFASQGEAHPATALRAAGDVLKEGTERAGEGWTAVAGRPDPGRDFAENAERGSPEEASDEKRKRRKKKNKKEDPGVAARRLEATRGEESPVAHTSSARGVGFEQKELDVASGEQEGRRSRSPVACAAGASRPEPLDGTGDLLAGRLARRLDSEPEEASAVVEGCGERDDALGATAVVSPGRRQARPGQGDERGSEAKGQAGEREPVEAAPGSGEGSHEPSRGDPQTQFNLQPYPSSALGGDSPVVPVAALRQPPGSLLVYPPSVVVGAGEREDEDFRFRQMYGTWQRQQLYWHQIFLQRFQGEQFHLRRASQIQYAAWLARFYEHLQTNLPPSRVAPFFPLSAKQHVAGRDEGKASEPKPGATPTPDGPAPCTPNGLARGPNLGYLRPPSPLVPPQTGPFWNASPLAALATPAWHPHVLQDLPHGCGLAGALPRSPSDSSHCPSGSEDRGPERVDRDAATAAAGGPDEKREDAGSWGEANTFGGARDRDECRPLPQTEGVDVASGSRNPVGDDLLGRQIERGRDGQDWTGQSSGPRRCGGEPQGGGNRTRGETPPRGVPSLPSASLSLGPSAESVAHALPTSSPPALPPPAHVLNAGFVPAPPPGTFAPATSPSGPVAHASGPGPFLWNGLAGPAAGTLPTEGGFLQRPPGPPFVASPWMYYTLPYMRNVGGLGAGPAFYPYSGPPGQVGPGPEDLTQAKGLSTLAGVGPGVPGLTQPAGAHLFPFSSLLPQAHPVTTAGPLAYSGIQAFSPYLPGFVPAGRGYAQAPGAPEAHAPLGAPGGIGAGLVRPFVTPTVPGQIPSLAPAGEGAACLGHTPFPPVLMRPLAYPGVVGQALPQPAWGPGGLVAPYTHPTFLGPSPLPTGVAEGGAGAAGSPASLGTDRSYLAGSSSATVAGPLAATGFLQTAASFAVPRRFPPSSTSHLADARPNNLVFAAGAPVPASAQPSAPPMPVVLSLSGPAYPPQAGRALTWAVPMPPQKGGEKAGGQGVGEASPFASPTTQGEPVHSGVARSERGSLGPSGRRGDRSPELDTGAENARDPPRRFASPAPSGRSHASVELERDTASRDEELGPGEGLAAETAAVSPSRAHMLERCEWESPMAMHAEGGVAERRRGVQEKHGGEGNEKPQAVERAWLDGQRRPETPEADYEGTAEGASGSCRWGRHDEQGARPRVATLNLHPTGAPQACGEPDAASPFVHDARAVDKAAHKPRRFDRACPVGSLSPVAAASQAAGAWATGTDRETGESNGARPPFVRSRSSSCSLPARGPRASESPCSCHPPHISPSCVPATTAAATAARSGASAPEQFAGRSSPQSRCSCPCCPSSRASDSGGRTPERPRSPAAVAARCGCGPHMGENNSGKSCPCSFCQPAGTDVRPASRGKERREALHSPQEEAAHLGTVSESCGAPKESRAASRKKTAASSSTLSRCATRETEQRVPQGRDGPANSQEETEDRSDWAWSPRETRDGGRRSAPCGQCRCSSGEEVRRAVVDASGKPADVFASPLTDAASLEGARPHTMVDTRLSRTTARLLRKGKRAELNLRAFHACTTPAANCLEEDGSESEPGVRGRSRRLDADRRRRSAEAQGDREKRRESGAEAGGTAGEEELEKTRRSERKENRDDARASEQNGVAHKGGSTVEEGRDSQVWEAREDWDRGDRGLTPSCSDAEGEVLEGGREARVETQRGRQTRECGGEEPAASRGSSWSSCSSRRSSVERDAKEVKFSLEALWQSFEDASVYGLEIPFLDANDNLSFVVYIPYLSALHLYPASASLGDALLPSQGLPLPTGASDRGTPVSSREGARSAATSVHGSPPTSAFAQPPNGTPSLPASASGRAAWSPVLSGAGVSRSSSVSAPEPGRAGQSRGGPGRHAEGSERRGSASDDAKEGLRLPLTIPVVARRTPAAWTSSTSAGQDAAKQPSFKYTEVRLLYQRRPLFQQIERLLQGEEVMQSQQLNLLVSQSDDLDQDLSWLCVYWQAVQRDFRMTPAPSYLVYYRFRATRDKATGIPTLQRFATIPSRLDLPLFIHTGHRPLASSPAGDASDGSQRDASEAEGGGDGTRSLEGPPAEGGAAETRDTSERATVEFTEKMEKEKVKVTEWLRELRLNHPDFEHLKARGMGRLTSLSRRPGEG
ncbi:conserved hypothetical protein [Neospora caninum Liverpool]|uniref:Uncharacterized protein n=1 Tax=Neospora caninum (strain Liverpool) TaxID=572307 RepID=F0VN42_NEOCL|nr:conserved hypothetical protein [Neospora caninum Liverpool]CBZ55138.1 conserved hypothetical protein [Neospora caninum Liverpool]CEL69864.1 TPA: hypothetical protein BN1204_055630 [Neospora caninum Liverpool]|eukprot:XP_003885166.1 conserved hypothetical protein [Neospora caninum Liverpool]